MHLENVQESGVSKLFHPTTTRVRVRFDDDDQPTFDPNRDDGARSQELALLVRSRDQRKGRGSIVIPAYAFEGLSQQDKPSFPRQAKQVGRGIRRMFTTFPYWNPAFLCAFSYSVGSALFVVDGAFGWAPVAFPGSEFPGQTLATQLSSYKI